MNQPPDWVGEEDYESAYRFVKEKMREEGRWEMDNANVEAGAEDELCGQRGQKYRPAVDDNRVVLEMSPMDPSSSSLTSLPIHQALLKMNFVSFNGFIVENELNPQVHLML
ncbi:cation-chloride cotransporter 1-like [Pyrus ussuriensis x Pyrus communis]|uniref:Cation-chloride cotransporter 1-like n=1 Tax=Pyrus ussuriensis x Pyrus communis TaxID=2448454 RepID=A0A5N5FJG2_9ROSA|nr:cation-chloride cotransporter 1-like [Pyrus ussuriensis x Pyrus communis]